MKKVKIGIIGCGNICGIYLKNCTELFEILEVVACADIIPERAREKAKEFGIKAYTVDELLADPEIEVVVNLTIPLAHAEVCLAALKAGKNIYVEKPLSVTCEDGKEIVRIAGEKGLLAGGAPDTFMGAGIQTCRKLIDDGWIGRPVAAAAFVTNHGHENWHPDPEFFYKKGAGPMLDIGPYYITALVSLIGAVRRVTGSTQKAFEERTVTSKPKYGEVITVDVPTHVAGVLDFQNGAVGTIITSFDIWNAHLPRIEIYGSEGTLSVPDPNTFGGPVSVQRQGAKERTEMPLTHIYSENSRGLGVADMAYALRTGRAHRANSDLTFHVLEVMNGFQEASESGKHYTLESTCTRPAPLPLGLTLGKLDEK